MKNLLIHRVVPLGVAVIAILALPAPASAQTASYTYDNLNRLTSATISGSRIEYQYDAAGNILRVLTPYSIQVTKSGTGAASITDNLGKIDCGDDCSGVYDLNTSVTLTAVPEAGTTFSGWSGACTGTGTCQVTVGGAVSVGADFVSAGTDLAITKDDGLGSAIPGEAVTYTIVVSNNGPGDVDDAEVADTLPSDLTCTWTSIQSDGATGSAESGSGDISETLNLPSGASVTYTVACDIDPAATGEVANTATVSSAVSDPTPGDHSATDTNTLAPEADLWLTAAISPSEAGPGASSTATLNVGNRGPSTAASLVVANTLPAGATFVSAGGTDWSCADAGGVVTCNRAALSPDATSQITIDMTLPTAPGALSNSASVSSATSEAAPGDESDSMSVQVFGPPTIVDVTSVAMTEHGSMLTDTNTIATLTQIHLEASHELFDDTGHAGPTDVTNPLCYRLFQADPDGTFGSTTCGDESDIPIAGISYGEAGPQTVVLTLGNGYGLAARTYRLLVCGSGASHLEDVYGSPLDGNDDGTGGDDFVLDFQVRVTNLLVNPNLDEDLSGWTVVSEATGDVTHDPVYDAGNAATSGSARLVNLIGTGSALEISQCVPITADARYQVGLTAATASLGPTFPAVWGRVETFDGAGCSGSPLSLEEALLVQGDSGDAWVDAASLLGVTPPTALSARVTFLVSGDETNAEAWLDDLQYLHGIVIFVDEFESGQPNRWSAVASGN